MRIMSIPTVMAGCVVALVISTPSPLAAQTPQEHEHAVTDTARQAPGMEAKCQAMMAERMKMMADMKAADQRLDALVVTMNKASGTEKKMAATARVITEMVAQHQAMRDALMKMQDGMMSQMMEHMQARAESLPMCPMTPHPDDVKP
jgi:hypothetical protein